MASLRAILASFGSIGAVANARSALERGVSDERAVDELEARMAPSVTGAASSAA